MKKDLCPCGQGKCVVAYLCRDCYLRLYRAEGLAGLPARKLADYWPVHMARLSQQRLTTRPKDVAA